MLFIATSQYSGQKMHQQNSSLIVGGVVVFVVCQQMGAVFIKKAPQHWSLPKNGLQKERLLADFFDFVSALCEEIM